MNESKYKLYFYLSLFLLSLPQFVYRFNHPEMSETQLFLNFFNAYREFFMNELPWKHIMDERE